MFEHAVVAADLSANWPTLLERLPRLHRAGIRRLTLIHVLPRGMPGTARQDDRLMEESREQLGQAADWLNTWGFSADHEVLMGGEPAVAIDDYLEQTDASLVVLGRHGHGLLRDFFLGSTLYDLARSAGRPVWLEPLDNPPPGDGSLLLATNGSAGARNAEACARELQAYFENAIALIVDEGLGEPSPEEAEQHVRTHLPGFRVRLEQGRAYSTIETVARETGATLIVLGRSSHGSLRDLLWGSTAEQLCRRPPTSVMLIPSTPA